MTIGLFSNLLDAHKHARATVVKRGYLIYIVTGVGHRRTGFRQTWIRSDSKYPVRYRDAYQTGKWTLVHDAGKDAQ